MKKEWRFFFSVNLLHDSDKEWSCFCLFLPVLCFVFGPVDLGQHRWPQSDVINLVAFNVFLVERCLFKILTVFRGWS